MITKVKNTEEFATLIGSFMGSSFDEQNNVWVNSPANIYLTEVHWWNMKYHSSWDWIIPVTLKIDAIISAEEIELADDIYIFQNQMLNHIQNRDLELVIEDVVKFINWYNKTIKTIMINDILYGANRRKKTLNKQL